MNKPKISVIMSVHNAMPYLKQAVESVLHQTYQNFEFIIIDDKSTDNTLRYLKNIKDKRVKLIENKRNLGLASSLNKALKLAKGAYIARMDADDISLPDRLEKQLDFMGKNSSIYLCGCWVRLIDARGKTINSVHNPVSDKDIKRKNKLTTALLHPTWFSRRKVFDTLNGYDPKWDLIEDYEFLLRARDFKMANVDKELLLLRSQPNRRSQKDIQNMYEKSFHVKWDYFRRGDFGFWYFPQLLRSFISTYLFPIRLKIFLNKYANFI